MRAPTSFAGGPVGTLAVVLLLAATLAAGFGPPWVPARVLPRPEPVWTRPLRPVPRTPPRQVDVLRVIDGDTFDARLRGVSGDAFVRVRLRDIDAAELHARCASEFRKALAARRALAQVLDEGGVQISDVGQDKYPERIDAHVATRRTPDVSAALLRMGLVRAYDGGRRRGWCGRLSAVPTRMRGSEAPDSRGHGGT